MTEPSFPITPPPELVDKWVAMLEYCEDIDVFTDVARWGADQELEACLTEVSFWGTKSLAEKVRTSRRFKLQSFKEQALVALNAIALGANDTREFYQDIETIKTALETLPDD